MQVLLHVRFVSMHTMTSHPYVVMLNENLSTAPHDFAHDFIRKLMFCSTNFVTKKNINVCFQKMLPCLSNISF